MNILHDFVGDSLYGKFRFNILHNNTDPEWRLFVKNGNAEEVMHLVTAINCYVPFRTHTEWIDGKAHYSILAQANRIVIDDNLVGWIT